MDFRSTLRSRSALALPVLAAGVVLAQGASAQQFVHQPGIVPGGAIWAEGVECADIDNDGDLDIFFAEGEGFSSAGPKRQNKLILNRFIPAGALLLQDVSVARLGAHLSNAKGVATGDIDGDGWVDAMYANGFNTDPPSLYHNRGLAQPGFFDLESAARGFTESISSASSQFGDIDDDGDLDILLNDSGNSFLGAPGGLPRLYRNDGTGVFSEIAANVNTIVKQAHMDVQFVDIDGDWDLDFFGDNRQTNAGVNHYLLLNDGTGDFSVDASNLLPSTSSNCYEAEVGDLDGDTDIDIYYVSLTGLSEGAQLNQIVPSSTLSFTNGTSAGSDDDNEIVLIDYDMDGDYDAYVGSLRAGTDKMMRNNGSGTFALVNGVINGPGDSTLDCTAADLDNDGDYDLISAQGESNSAQWDNKVFLNTGPADTLPPLVSATDSPSAAGGVVVAHATVRDQVMDDGQDWLSGRTRYVVTSRQEIFDITYDGANFTPALANVTSGTTVRWTNTSGGAETLIGITGPYSLGLVLPPSGGQATYTFIEPMTYDYLGAFAGSGQVAVTGSPTSADALRTGVGYYRAEMPGSGNGILCYEWQFTDWAGNLGVGAGQTVEIGPFTYCTAKVNSQGCTPATAASGIPSLSDPNPFTISAAQVLNLKNGLLFYGYNSAAIAPFQGGTLCVLPPLRRTAVQNSGGTAPPTNDCSGTYSFDMNALIQSGADPFLTLGQQVNAQFWSRDPAIGDGTGTGLTDAVQFVVGS